MAKKSPAGSVQKVSPEQIEYLKRRMEHLTHRNASWGIDSSDYRRLYQYLAAQKITYLYDDELFERMIIVDHSQTGIQEELLDAYLIVDQGDVIELKLFQFKYTGNFTGGISTTQLYAFVDRMNKVFLRGDLQDSKTLEAYRMVREALSEAMKANSRARIRVQCYYVVNGQNISDSDSAKVQELRDVFSFDRQTYGFTFETYGALDIYNLCALGRIPIQEETLELEYEWKESSYLFHNIGANPNGMPQKVLVGFVNVNHLIRLVDRYSNNELFEKNVRLFLGTGKEVNSRIIQTITSNQSPWFGFMNNGVSIVAESVDAILPPSNNRVRLKVKGMQIINGCQTVNALYHAKYDPQLRDRFQGNSNVMVRVYEIDPANTNFLDALIIATNSQNAIRPEDLLSNDRIQVALQSLFSEYNIGYERKEGESVPPGRLETFSKEQAAMAYLAVFMGYSSKLRNSLSRREFFREGTDYYKAFDLKGEGDPGPLPEDFVPGTQANERALQILAARRLEESCRGGIKAISDKRDRGSLRKGAYYMARIIYLKNQSRIDQWIHSAAAQERTARISQDLRTNISSVAEESMEQAMTIFRNTLDRYLKKHGGNEDAALKNTLFSAMVDEAAHNS